MTLKLYNSLTEKKENFIPIDKNNIKLYACGLTVYDNMHIGHARTTIFVDVLYKLLKVLYKNVTYVRNITDVDDKINIRAKEKKITIQTLTKNITQSCNEDMLYLGNEKPTIEPKVTEHIQEIIDFIKILIKKGSAYIAENHVLFNINSYKKYGILSKKNLQELEAGSRINIENYKKNPMDFVLWKPSLDIDDESSKFDSPWGLGRPGWHIECSAMSNKYLGENFDIHCGGVDLKFPHHENEIAQSCSAFPNSNFANFWFHIGALMVNNEKMSKSLGNFITINEIKNKNIKGSTLRFSMLKNHYRKPFNFKYDLIEESQNNLVNFHKELENIDCEYKIPNELIEILSDDLNTPNVIALLNKFNKNKELANLKNSLIFLNIFDKSFFEKKKILSLEKKWLISEEEINTFLLERSIAKQNKDWKKADEIRNFLKERNVVVKDGGGGVEWKYII